MPFLDFLKTKFSLSAPLAEAFAFALAQCSSAEGASISSSHVALPSLQSDLFLIRLDSPFTRSSEELSAISGKVRQQRISSRTVRRCGRDRARLLSVSPNIACKHR